MMNFFKKLFNFHNSACHGACAALSCNHKIAIAGSPNVGKSVLFNCLTGSYAVVSNYPGTTVEVTRGKLHIDGKEVEVVDTPGMYSLLPLTEEERVARNIFIEEKPGMIIHVVDAKNLERMLPLTLQFIEAGIRVILVVNIIDEAQKLGIVINAKVLERELNIPVVLTAAAVNQGIDELRQRIGECLCK